MLLGHFFKACPYCVNAALHSSDVINASGTCLNAYPFCVTAIIHSSDVRNAGGIDFKASPFCVTAASSSIFVWNPPPADSDSEVESDIMLYM